MYVYVLFYAIHVLTSYILHTYDMHICIHYKGHVKCFGSGGTWGEMEPPLLPLEQEEIKAEISGKSLLAESESDEDSLGTLRSPSGDRIRTADEVYDDVDESEDEDLSTTYDDEVENEEEVNIDDMNRHQQFKQISVGEDLSCGILLYTSDLICWGKQGLHKNMLTNVPGPIRQVSVNKLGVCVLYDKGGGHNSEGGSGYLGGELQCWGIADSVIPISFTTSSASVVLSPDGSVSSDTAHIQPGRPRFAQVKVGLGGTVCAVGEGTGVLTCWGRTHIPSLTPPVGLIVAA